MTTPDVTAPEIALAVEPPKPRTPLFRALRALLVIAIVALLVLFARTVNWHEAWTSIRNADRRWLLAAAVVNLLSIVVTGIRWWIFLRRVGVDRPGLAIRAALAGAGLNNVLVANGGEAARVVFVARASSVPAGTILATLAIERVFDLVGYVLFLAVAALVLPLPEALSRWRWPAAAALVVALGLLYWMVLRARVRRASGVLAIHDAIAPAGAGFASRTGVRLRNARGQFLNAMALVAGMRRFAAALLLSVIAWAMQLATFAWTARAAGLPLPLAGDVATLLAVNLGFLVRATPGNVGFFQLAYALAAEPFGATRDGAIAVALLIQTLQIIPVTLLGVAMAPEFLLKRKPKPAPAR
ncbi:MAG TPA: lysylphosphatidylglycerol synthase transmembrane domain-containing protein [Gemmatimonadaceae bacterium]|nr:lysylphosphatidylglycerol synthase transmembrane domain-containing protein [Gemmatimonadaceae bacterium]